MEPREEGPCPAACGLERSLAAPRLRRDVHVLGELDKGYSSESVRPKTQCKVA